MSKTVVIAMLLGVALTSASCTTDSANIDAANSNALGMPAETGTPAPAQASAPTTASATPRASITATRSASAPRTKPATRASSRGGTPGSPAGDTDVAHKVLAQINGWRSDAGLAPLTMSTPLVRSAHAHNLAMAHGCGLSHQCPGEASLGDRIAAQGVRTMGWAENVGTGSRVTNSTNAILSMASSLDTQMFGEKPPNDGHRRNLLSPTLTRIGIDVIRDSDGNVWLTQDFAR